MLFIKVTPACFLNGIQLGYTPTKNSTNGIISCSQDIRSLLVEEFINNLCSIYHTSSRILSSSDVNNESNESLDILITQLSSLAKEIIHNENTMKLNFENHSQNITIKTQDGYSPWLMKLLHLLSFKNTTYYDSIPINMFTPNSLYQFLLPLLGSTTIYRLILTNSIISPPVEYLTQITTFKVKETMMHKSMNPDPETTLFRLTRTTINTHILSQRLIKSVIINENNDLKSLGMYLQYTHTRISS